MASSFLDLISKQAKLTAAVRAFSFYMQNETNQDEVDLTPENIPGASFSEKELEPYFFLSLLH